MGGQISKMMGKIFGSKEMRLLMLGLDAAGKTSELLLYLVGSRAVWWDGAMLDICEHGRLNFTQPFVSWTNY
jgi:hypothetical protein